MADMESAWGQVGDRMSALLLKLKYHAEEELSEEDLKAQAGLDKVRTVFEEAVQAIEDAVTDQAVRDDAKHLGRALVDAVDATINSVEERLRSQ